MTDFQLTKICRDCKRELPLESFHKNKGCKDGVRPECRECVHKKRIEYYARTREKSQAYSRNYYHENAEHVKSYVKKHAERNKLKNRERLKRWREANREKLLVDKRNDYMINKEKYAERSRQYQKQHPEYGRISHHRRRAQTKGVSGTFTAQQLLAKFDYFGWRCYLCHTSLSFKDLELDHRKPLALGGSNWIANIAPACQKCNQTKGNKTESEFRAITA